MPDLTTTLPARRPELVLSPLDDKGRCVVKDPRTGNYYNLGELEYFLLLRLDGAQDAEAICTAFEAHFDQPLSPEELHEFVEMADACGFLLPPPGSGTVAGEGAPRPVPPPSGSRPPQNLLYWRKKVLDPDRLFNRLAPRLWFVWTMPFFAVSAGCILAAVPAAWADRQELVAYAPNVLHWETLALVWLTVVVTTTCHEFAHGLTCKRYGGEVHDLGFMMIFLMPAFYCNVSDAWLFREKSKRLWVTAAGSYCDLCQWALATFVWRATLPSSPFHHLAWVVLSVCGVRVFFNLNPLIKLDGYYLFSDLVEIPNLQQRGLWSLMGHLRWLLWGAPRPGRTPRGKFLLGFGTVSWLFSVGFLVYMLVTMARFLGMSLGLAGIVMTALLGGILMRGLLQGLFAGEVGKMILLRRKRATLWGMALAALPGVLGFYQVEDRAGGSFHVRSVTRAELRAPVAGFLRMIYHDEGDRISPGGPVAVLEVPDLSSRVEQARAGVREAQAKVCLLEVGPRPEEVLQQRHRVDRAKSWRDLAKHDLTRLRLAFQKESAEREGQITRYRIELDNVSQAFTRSKKLLGQGMLSQEQYKEAETKYRVALVQLQQAEAQHLAHQAQGTLEAEAELARREKDLADAEATLTLLEAGARPEEIEVERARLARLQEEASYLEELQGKQQVSCPVRGVIATPRLGEKVGQYFREGELICEVETPSALEVEIALPEQDVARVRPGQRVKLRTRAQPFQALQGIVDRIAPHAVASNPAPGLAPSRTATAGDESQRTVTVYGHLESPTVELRPGMTGYARINCGRRPIGEVLARRALRHLRTEYWLWW